MFLSFVQFEAENVLTIFLNLHDIQGQLHINTWDLEFSLSCWKIFHFPQTCTVMFAVFAPKLDGVRIR